MLLRARQFEFRFSRPTLLMGIVNVTPDSFSDGHESVAQQDNLATLPQCSPDLLVIGMCRSG